MKKILYFLICNLLIASAAANNFSVQVFDVDGQPVENIVVYLKPFSGGETLEVNKKQLVIDQKNKKFAPYITVMQKGQRIQFENLDDITHHIYSASGGNRFEFKLKAGENKLTEPMLATDEIAMGCNIHDWMSGFTLVVDTPYFNKTDEQGKAVLTLSQLGEFEITVWHPQLALKDNRFSTQLLINNANLSKTYQVTLPKKLNPIPLQENQEEFEFLEEY